MPERTDLLGLSSRSKDLTLDAQRDERLEVLGFGITAARFPGQHRSP